MFCNGHVTSPRKCAYKECFLSIPAAYNNIVGDYQPVLYLDQIESIIPGREIWGYNKTLADIQYTEQDNRVDISVIRQGVAMMYAEARQRSVLTSRGK